jgi:two-component system, chemotaxis family, sensor kinase CheA
MGETASAGDLRQPSAISLPERLDEATEALRELTGLSEAPPEALLSRLCGALQSVEASLGTGAVAQASLVAASLAVLERTRSLRLPLERFQLAQLGRAVELLRNGDPMADQHEDELLALAADLAASDETGSGLGDWALFVEDACGQLDACVHDLSQLKGDPAGDASAVARAFRSLHTFKGNCGIVGAAELEGLARLGEEVLAGLRSGELAPTQNLRAALRRFFMAMRESLPKPGEEVERAGRALLLSSEQARRVAEETRLGTLLLAKQLVDPLDVQAALALKGRPLGEVLIELRALTPLALDHALAEQRHLRGGEGLPAELVDLESGVTLGALGSAETRPRLVQLLDGRVSALVRAARDLADRVDELARGRKDADELAGLSDTVRAAALRVHLMPLTSAFRRADLAVHALRETSKKPVTLRVMGEDLEVDRQTLEAVSTTLLHCVRNSMDHGIESPEERLRAGKAALATLRVACSLGSPGLRLEFTDDGRGLDPEKLRAKAAEFGLDASSLSPDDLLQLVFQPGFSTAKHVTDTSGRGVGLDAVRAKVEVLGGSVHLGSRRGHGVSLVVRLPHAEAHRCETPAELRGSSGQWRVAPPVGR